MRGHHRVDGGAGRCAGGAVAAPRLGVAEEGVPRRDALPAQHAIHRHKALRRRDKLQAVPLELGARDEVPHASFGWQHLAPPELGVPHRVDVAEARPRPEARDHLLLRGFGGRCWGVERVEIRGWDGGERVADRDKVIEHDRRGAAGRGADGGL